MSQNRRRAAKTSQSKVRGEYAAGVGWEAGQIAPETKYVDNDGQVVDDEPKGGGHVLVMEGDVVRPHMVEALNSGTSPVVGSRYDNEHSPGDASNSRETRRADADADDAATTDATVGGDGA